MPLRCGTIMCNITLTKLNLSKEVQPVLYVVTTVQTTVVECRIHLGETLFELCSKWHAHNGHCSGLVAIPPVHLKPTTVATRRHETHYMQIWCVIRVCTAGHSSQVQSNCGTIYLQTSATFHPTVSNLNFRRST